MPKCKCPICKKRRKKRLPKYDFFPVGIMAILDMLEKENLK